MPAALTVDLPLPIRHGSQSHGLGEEEVEIPQGGNRTHPQRATAF